MLKPKSPSGTPKPATKKPAPKKKDDGGFGDTDQPAAKPAKPPRGKVPSKAKAKAAAMLPRQVR